jgi:hypothetical protein
MADKTVLVTGATGTVSTALLGALKGSPDFGSVHWFGIPPRPRRSERTVSRS